MSGLPGYASSGHGRAVTASVDEGQPPADDPVGDHGAVLTALDDVAAGG